MYGSTGAVSFESNISNACRPIKGAIIVYNQWAATALNKYHPASKVLFVIQIDNSNKIEIELKWNSDFSSDL